MPGSFVDANVLIYLAAGDAGKAETAARLLEEGATISVQVLNETAIVLRRKAGLTWPEIEDFVGTVTALAKVMPLTIETHVAGLQLAERHQLAIYDAMIAAAARIANCTTLWSEDMQDGLVIDGALHIRNPFRS